MFIALFCNGDPRHVGSVRRERNGKLFTGPRLSVSD